MLKQKGKEWLKRYLPAEIVGTVVVMIAAGIAHLFTENLIIIAYAGAVGESIGFYATILIQNILSKNKERKVDNSNFSFRHFVQIITNIIIEFGPAGLIDGLLLRPFFLYLFPILLDNFMLGILVGKIVGDITFYIFVIISYELNKRRKGS
ncbi:MAG: hypothetical protein SGJ10_07245 [Bacteroidota bacterium]|nr:hypothetical protein [Bacteroidota bacterium]